jgi:hypothetical protein
MLNYLKGELDLKEKSRLSIYDSQFQFGVAKVHYDADLVDNPSYGEAMRDENDNVMMDESGNVTLEPEVLPANESYCLTRVHPNDIIFDEDAGPLENEWNWIAQRITCTVDEVKNDKRYKKSVREDVQPTEMKDDVIKEQEKRKKGFALADKGKAEPNIVVKYEVWNLKERKWFVISEGSDDFLLEPQELPPGIDKHPFIFLRFFLRDSSPYPIPPCTQWIDSQREYCESRSKYLTHRKRFNRKYTVYKPGLDDDVEMSKLENGEDGTIIMVNQPIEIVRPISDAPLDQNNWNEMMAIRKDFDDVAVGPNQRGSATGVDSATEAGILEKRTLIQEGDDIARIADFLTRIGEKLDMLVQAHLTNDQLVNVTGMTGELEWIPIRMQDYSSIDAEYKYSVNVSQMQPQIPEVERAQFLAFLSLFASAPQIGMSKRLLSKVAEMHHIDDETLVNELVTIFRQMTTGALPMPGQQGSTPGTPAMPQAQMGAGMGIANFRGGQQ